MVGWTSALGLAASLLLSVGRVGAVPIPSITTDLIVVHRPISALIHLEERGFNPPPSDVSDTTGWRKQLKTLDNKSVEQVAKETLTKPGSSYKFPHPDPDGNPGSQFQYITMSDLQTRRPNTWSGEVAIEHLVELQTGVMIAEPVNLKLRKQGGQVAQRLAALENEDIDFEIDGTTKKGSFWDFQGELYNGEGNLGMLANEPNNVKACRVPQLWPVVRKGVPRRGVTRNPETDKLEAEPKGLESNNRVNGPVLETYREHIRLNEDKMDKRVGAIKRLNYVHADRIETDVKLKQLLAQKLLDTNKATDEQNAEELAETQLKEVAKETRDRADLAVEYYKKGGLLSKDADKLVTEHGSTPAPAELTASFKRTLYDEELPEEALSRKRKSGDDDETDGQNKKTKVRKPRPNQSRYSRRQQGEDPNAPDCPPSKRDGLFKRAGCVHRDKNGSPLDKDGFVIDDQGYSRTDNGNYVSEDGKEIDSVGRLLKNGKPVTADGAPIVADPKVDDEIDRNFGTDGETDTEPFDGTDASGCTGSRSECGALSDAVDASEAGEELEWGFTNGGSEDREALIALEESEFFADTELVDGKLVAKKKGPRRFRLFPRAVREADGKLARVKDDKVGEQNDVTESTADAPVKNDPYGSPYENYEGEITPYAGIVDNDMDMSRFTGTTGYLSHSDLHAAVGDGVNARMAEARDGSNLLTAEQAAGAQQYFGHMQKAIKARKNRIQRPIPKGQEGEVVGRSTPEATAFAKSQVNNMEDAFNVARGPGDINVAATEKAAACGAACEKLEPQNELRFAVGNLRRKRSTRRGGCSRVVSLASGHLVKRAVACNRARGKVLKPSTVSALAKMKGVIPDKMFTGDKTPTRPPADGKWVPNDIKDTLGDDPEDFEKVWTELSSDLSSFADNKLNADQLSGLQDAMNAWEDDITAATVDENNAVEHVNSVEGYNRVAAKLNGKGYGNAGLRTRPVTYTSPNAPTAPDTSTPGRDLAAFAGDAKEATGSEKILPRGPVVGREPLAAELFAGAADMDAATDGILGEVQQSFDSDVATTLSEGKQKLLKSWRKLINKKTARLLRSNDRVRSRDEVADRDIHLQSYNNIAKAAGATYKPESVSSSPIESTADLRPLDHVTAMLETDAIVQAKAITDDPAILPAGGAGPDVDAAGDYTPNSLYANARSMTEAIDGVLRSVSFTLSRNGNGATLGAKKTIRLQRLRNNLRKAAAAREKSIQGAIKKEEPVDRKDVQAYQDSHGNSAKFDRAAVDYKQVEGQTLSAAADGGGGGDTGSDHEPGRQVSGTTGGDSDSSGSDNFPSYESPSPTAMSNGLGATPRDFTKYKNLVSGKRTGAIRKYKKLTRKPPRGATPKSGAGTLSGRKP
ncbi:hypothetical protein HDU86_007497 [Geranomyces michiganensis]|nr:hypothetical protein HDU86_007497 [Geranomyces michiganensis]